MQYQLTNPIAAQRFTQLEMLMSSTPNRSPICSPIARGIFTAALLCVGIQGCTWVKLEDAAKRIRVMDASDSLSSCEDKGEITASVEDRILSIKRERTKVLDEVEALARNSAVELGADTIAPSSELAGGERRYRAYRCK
jgi:hypothetical protein